MKLAGLSKLLYHISESNHGIAPNKWILRSFHNRQEQWQLSVTVFR